MALSILTFGGVTASTVKSRADIPITASTTVNGSYLDCADIKISQIASVLGSSSNSLSVLCGASAVNKYSGYGPTEYYISSGSMLNRVKTPYTVGSFAGYDHAALGPYFLSNSSNFSIIEGATSTTVNASLMLGQYNWWLTDLYFGAVTMEVSISGSVVATQIVNLTQSTFLTTSIDFNQTINVTGWTTAHTLTCAFYFAKDAAHSNAKLCAVPNISSFNVVISVDRLPRVGTFLASSGLAAILGKSTAVLITTSGDLSSLSVNMSTNYVTVACHGVDTNGDGIGDLGLTLKDRNLYWRKNGGTWNYLNVMSMPIDTGVSGSYGMGIYPCTYNDIIDVEVR